MPRTTKTFRVFVSSTFADMRQERRVLQAEVFPKLKTHCEQQGASFQAIDLRWGVNEASQRDQKTMEICLSEIARCQRISPRPNFILLLGDRYGWQPIPARIPSSEMTELLSCLESDEAALITQWYREDTNALPPEYVLQPKREHHWNSAAWEATEHSVQKILRKALDTTHLSVGQKAKYSCSATHQEIICGAMTPFEPGNDPADHVFAYLRNMEDLPQDETARGFVDLLPDGTLDSDAKAQLDRLKIEIAERLPEDHVYRYRSQWNASSVHFDEVAFARTVHDNLKCVIDRELLEIVPLDELTRETRIHDEFRIKLTESFTGQEGALRHIASYVQRGGGKALAVIGPSGSGKSSLIAKAIDDALASSLLSRRGQGPSEAIVFRFLGVTSSSSNPKGLLRQLSDEIAQSYGVELSALLKGEQPGAALSTYEGLRELFTKCVALATREHPLLIFLDALDQLPASTYDFLDFTLPDHARIIVSALPELENRLPFASTFMLPTLSEHEGNELLDKWLFHEKRVLTPEQREEIACKFRDNGLPIYLRLIFEQARTWHSFDIPEALPRDVDGMLREYFDALMKSHTEELVRKAVGYLLSGRYEGLTEAELLAILAFDDAYWHGFLATCHPDLRSEVENPRTLPAVVWSRLYLDLAPYLTERDADGTKILVFFHRVFREYALRHFTLRHATLAHYFENEPLHLDAGGRVANVRKLVEQPYQQRLGDRTHCIRTMSDFDFLYAKVLSLGPAALLDDYDGLLDDVDALPSPESPRIPYLDELRRSLQMSAHILESRPREFPAQMVGRLRDSQANPFVPDLLRLASQAANHTPHFLPRTASLLRAGGRYLRSLVGHDSAIHALALTTDQRYLVSGGSRTRLLIWDLASGYRCRELPYPHGVVSALASLDEPHLFIAGSGGGMLSLWDASTGLCTRSLSVGDSEILGLCDLGGGRVAASELRGTIVIWDTRADACVTIVPVQRETAHSLACASDGAWLVTGHKGGWVRVWDTETGSLVRESRALDEHEIGGLLVPHRSTYALTTSKGVFLRLWNLSTGAPMKEWLLTRMTSGMAYNTSTREVILFAGSTGITMDPSLYAVAFTADTDSKLKLKLSVTYQCKNNPSPVSAFVLNERGTTGFSGGRDGVIRQWDLRPEIAESDQERHTRPVSAIAFIPGQERVATGAGGESGKDYLASEDGFIWGTGRLLECANSGPADFAVRCWDTRSGVCQRTLTPNTSAISGLAALPGQAAVVSMEDSRRMAISRLDGTPEPRVFEHVGWVLAVSADGLTVVTEGERHALLQIETSTGAVRNSMPGHEERVTGIAIHPDQLRAVSAGHDGRVMLWSLVRGTRLFDVVGHKKWIEELLLTPDGSHALTTCQGNELGVWQIDARTLRRAARQGGFGRLLAIRSDGRGVLARSSEGIALWSLPDIVVRRESTQQLTWATFLPDGSLILGLHSDGYLLLMGAEDLDPIASYSSDTPIRVAAYGARERMVAAGDEGGRVHFLDLLGYAWDLPLAVEIEQRKGWARRRRFMRCPICGGWTRNATGHHARCAVCGQECQLAGPPSHVRWSPLEAQDR